MITPEAIRRTIKQIERRNGLVSWKDVTAILRSIMNNQDDLDEEHEKQHNEIINEIGQY